MMDGAEMGEQRPAEVMLHEDEEINELLRRGYRIIQKKSGFRFGIDAVLLSWFAGAVGEEECVIDLGSGTGVIPLLMDARNGRGQYLGLEIDPRMTAMASRSAEINVCTERVRFVTGDLKEASKRLGTGSFDVVTANPPYRKTGTGKLSPDPMKAAARHEVLCTLRDVIREAAALLRSGGRFFMVHRAERRAEILELLPAYGFLSIRLLPVAPGPGKDPNLLLIAAEKAAEGGALNETCGPQAETFSEEPPLIVYDGAGNYTEEILKIYRE